MQLIFGFIFFLLPFGSAPKAPASTPYKVVIDKSEYVMQIYDTEGWYASYPVVFGSKNQADKKMEGDKLTPNGSFKIIAKKDHSQWGKFMLLDYPNEESLRKFRSRKSSGAIPASAKIGGAIGIHGTRPNEEYAVDKYMNWTNGCISTKYSDIFEIYDMLPIGTQVEILE
jgi:murein L,D-transpeptidase YafK